MNINILSGMIMNDITIRITWIVCYHALYSCYKMHDELLWTCYTHVMDVYMNVSLLADYINVSTIVAIGAGALDALYF